MHQLGLGYAVLEAGVRFGAFNGMKDQIVQRKTAIQGIEVIHIIFCELL